MNPQPQQEPACTTKCPAIRDDNGTWWCQIMKACVAPYEHRSDYGFEIIKEGKIKHGGYHTPCEAMTLFSRPAPSEPEDSDNGKFSLGTSTPCKIFTEEQLTKHDATIRNQTLEEAIALDWDPIVNSKEKIVDALKSLRSEVPE